MNILRLTRDSSEATRREETDAELPYRLGVVVTLSIGQDERSSLGNTSQWSAAPRPASSPYTRSVSDKCHLFPSCVGVFGRRIEVVVGAGAGKPCATTAEADTNSGLFLSRPGPREVPTAYCLSQKQGDTFSILCPASICLPVRLCRQPRDISGPADVNREGGGKRRDRGEVRRRGGGRRRGKMKRDKERRRG